MENTAKALTLVTQMKAWNTATNSKAACRSFKDLFKATCKHDNDTDESLNSHAFGLFTELQEPTEQEKMATKARLLSITKINFNQSNHF